jgi:hypothetical protein
MSIGRFVQQQFSKEKSPQKRYYKYSNQLGVYSEFTCCKWYNGPISSPSMGVFFQRECGNQSYYEENSYSTPSYHICKFNLKDSSKNSEKRSSGMPRLNHMGNIIAFKNLTLNIKVASTLRMSKIDIEVRLVLSGTAPSLRCLGIHDAANDTLQYVFRGVSIGRGSRIAQITARVIAEARRPARAVRGAILIEPVRDIVAVDFDRPAPGIAIVRPRLRIPNRISLHEPPKLGE